MKNLLSEKDINILIKESPGIQVDIFEVVDKITKEILADDVKKYEIVFNSLNILGLKDFFTGATAILGYKITFELMDKNITFVLKETKIETKQEKRLRLLKELLELEKVEE